MMKRRDRKYCPHANLRGIYGDEANHGFRLWCMDCDRPISGPVSLAKVREFSESWSSGLASGTRSVRDKIYRADTLRRRSSVLKQFAQSLEAKNSKLVIEDAFGVSGERSRSRVLNTTEQSVAIPLLLMIADICDETADMIDRTIENGEQA